MLLLVMDERGNEIVVGNWMGPMKRKETRYFPKDSMRDLLE